MAVVQKRTRPMRQTKQNSMVTRDSVRLITLAPGHFHASLVQKVMYPQVAPTVSGLRSAGCGAGRTFEAD